MFNANLTLCSFIHVIIHVNVIFIDITVTKWVKWASGKMSCKAIKPTNAVIDNLQLSGKLPHAENCIEQT